MTLGEKTDCKQTTKARATGHQRIKLTRVGEGRGEGGSWKTDGKSSILFLLLVLLTQIFAS